MQVLIVAKTHMSAGFCVGAFDQTNKINIRLLTAHEKNQPLDTPFDIGQIWEIDYIARHHITPPHIEDVIVRRAVQIRTKSFLNEYLIKTIPIWKGNPDIVFSGKIKFPLGQSGYLEQHNASLGQSVGFWLPDQDIELTIFDDHKHYYYFGDQVYVFPYVGTREPIDKIRTGSLIRLSLARWWSPDDKQPKRCYCQLSGWYEK